MLVIYSSKLIAIVPVNKLLDWNTFPERDIEIVYQMIYLLIFNKFLEWFTSNKDGIIYRRSEDAEVKILCVWIGGAAPYLSI
jgi:hypothetical protein